MVADFVGPDPSSDTVVFANNVSEAIEKLGNGFAFRDEPMISSSIMENHSNDLLWRRKVRVI